MHFIAQHVTEHRMILIVHDTARITAVHDEDIRVSCTKKKKEFISMHFF